MSFWNPVDVLFSILSGGRQPNDDDFDAVVRDMRQHEDTVEDVGTKLYRTIKDASGIPSSQKNNLLIDAGEAISKLRKRFPLIVIGVGLAVLGYLQGFFSREKR